MLELEGRAGSRSAVGLHPGHSAKFQWSPLTALALAPESGPVANPLSLAEVVVVVEIRRLEVVAHSPEVEAPLAGMVKTRAVGTLVCVEEEHGSPAGA